MRASVTVVHVDVLPFGWHCGVSSFLCWFVYFLPPSSSRRDLLVYFLMTKCPWMLSKGHVSWLPSWSPDVHWGIRWLQPCLSGVLQQWDSGYRWNLGSERKKIAKIWWALLYSHVVKTAVKTILCSVFDLPVLSCLLVQWVTLSVPQNKI